MSASTGNSASDETVMSEADYTEIVAGLTRMFSEVASGANLWFSPAAVPEADDLSEQFQMCEDMTSQCHAICSAIELVLSSGIEEAAVLLRELLITAGMSVSYFGKLRLSETDGRTARLLHLYSASVTNIKICSYSRESFSVKILDMDSELDPIFPSCSDLSLLVKTPEGNPAVILVDYTYGPMSDIKKEALEKAAFQISSQHGVSAMGIIVQFKHGASDIFKDYMYDRHIECPTESILTMSEKAVDNLGMQIQRSTEQEVRSFLMSLSELMDPILDEYARKAMEMPNDQAELFKELAALHSYVDSVHPTLEVNLRDAIETARYDSADILIRLIQIAEFRGLKIAKGFLERPFKTCVIGNYREPLRTAIPLLCPEVTLRDAIFRQGCDIDPFFHVISIAVNDFSEDSYKRGFWVMEGKKRVPCVESWVSNFNRPQDLRMTFPKGVIGAYRRSVYYKTEKKKDATGKEISEKVLTFEPGACVLINPDYTNDSAFIKFLSRRTPDIPQKAKAEQNYMTGSPEGQSKTLKQYMEMLQSLCPTDDEAELRARASFSSIDKVDLLLLNCASENLKIAFHEGRTLIDNPILDSLDERYQAARGMSSAMSAFRKPNYATYINSSQYCSWTFMYVNSPITNFKTTWIRRMTLSTDLYCAYSELSGNRMSMIYPMSERVVAPLGRYSPREVFSNFKGEEAVWVSSKFHSIDKNQLEWDLMAAPRAIVKCASLYEHRRSLYSEPGKYRTTNPDSTCKGRDFGRLEALMQASTFLHNSQQMSVIYEGTRFLHQSLSSLDCDFAGVLKKIAGVKVKTAVELSGFLFMGIPYSLAVMLRASEGLNTLKVKSREVRVLLGGLIKATSDPTFNVGLYSISSQLNDVKFNRVPAEASCVSAVWKANRELKETQQLRSDYYDALPPRLAFEWGTLGLNQESYRLKDYAQSLEDEIESVRDFHLSFLTLARTATYVSSTLVEVYANLKLRFEIGTVASVSSLSGKDISSQFTTRGSHVNKDFRAGVRTQSVRKASALLAFLGAMKTDPKEHYDDEGIMKLRNLQDRISEVIDLKGAASPQVDYYTVFLCMATNTLVSYPTIQLSQKDARGKDREISTLNVTYGMRNIMAEEIAGALSKNIPEDIIMGENKERDITNFVKASTQSKLAAAEGQSILIFINQDKSAFGPNKKFISFLVYAACLSPDRETYSFLRETFLLGKVKQVRYPNELLKQSLGKVTKADMENQNGPDSNRDARSTLDMRSKTSITMAKIAEQFHSGNENGPKGTDFTVVPEGMPGQGIMGISSSIQHAAALRLFTEVISRNFGWLTKAVVTSDDSMTVLVFPQNDLNTVKHSFRNLNNRLVALVGLIDNDSKFSCTMDKGEMNSLFFVRDMPCMPVEKFAMAFTHLTSSADFPQDILKASGTCGDLVRKGGTFFLSSVMAAVNMVQIIDVHRFWSVYVSDMSSGLNDIALNPVQAYGLPDINPIMQVICPLGSMFKPLDRDFESNLSAHAFWATNHFLQVPELASFEGDVEESESSAVAKMDDARMGSVSYVRPISYWGLTGVRGMLRRPKGTLRLAREISPSLISLRDKGQARNLLGKLNAAGLVSSVLDALSNPIDRGDGDKPAYLQHSDLAHSRDKPVLSLKLGSPLQKIFNKPKVSKSELSGFLSKSATAERLRSLHMNEVRKSFEMSSGKPTSHIELSLKSELEFSMKIAASASKIRLRKSEENIVVDESEGTSGPLPVFKYRVVKMGAQRLGNVGRDDIKRHIFDMTCSPSEWAKLSLKERRLNFPQEPRGEMTLNDSLSLSSNSAERLNAILNPTNQIVARFPDGVFGRRDLIITWVRGNTMLGAAGSMLTDFTVFSEMVQPVGASGIGTVSSDWPDSVKVALKSHSNMTNFPKAGKEVINGIPAYAEASSRFWSFSGTREPSLRGSLSRAELIPALMELAFIGREAIVSRSVLGSALEHASQRGYMAGPRSRSRYRVISLLPDRKSRALAYLIRSQALPSDGPPTVFKYRHTFLFSQEAAQERTITLRKNALHASEMSFIRGIGSPLSSQNADASSNASTLKVSSSKVGVTYSEGGDHFSANFLRPNLKVRASIERGTLILELPDENIFIPVSFCVPVSEISLPKDGLRPTMILSSVLLPSQADTLELLAEKLSKLSLLALRQGQSSEAYGLAKTICMRMPKKSDNPGSIIAALEKSLLDYVADGLVKFTFKAQGLKPLASLNEDLQEEEYMEPAEEMNMGSWADQAMEEEQDLSAKINASLDKDKKLLSPNMPFISVNYLLSPTEVKALLRDPNDSWPRQFLFAAGVMNAIDTLRQTVPLGFTTIDLPERDWKVELDKLNLSAVETSRSSLRDPVFSFKDIASQLRYEEIDAVAVSKSANLAKISLQLDALPVNENIMAELGSFDFDYGLEMADLLESDPFAGLNVEAPGSSTITQSLPE